MKTIVTAAILCIVTAIAIACQPTLSTPTPLPTPTELPTWLVEQRFEELKSRIDCDTTAKEWRKVHSVELVEIIRTDDNISIVQCHYRITHDYGRKIQFTETHQMRDSGTVKKEKGETAVLVDAPKPTNTKSPAHQRVKRDPYPTLSASCERYWSLANQAGAGPNASDDTVGRFHDFLASETGDRASTWDRFRAGCWLSGR